MKRLIAGKIGLFLLKRAVRTPHKKDCAKCANAHQWLNVRQFPNSIEQHARGTTIILVVIENSLLDDWIVFAAPAVEPFDRGRPGGMSIPPSETEMLGERLGRRV